MGFSSLLIGTPIAASTFLSILSLNDTSSFVVFVGVIIGAAAIGGVIYALFSSVDTISFLTFSVSLSDWGKRFSGIVAFMGTYFIGTTLTGLGLLASIPLSIGVIVWGVLIIMFVFGVFAWSVGDVSGGSA